MGQQLLFLQIKTKHQILKGVSVKETKRWGEGGGGERERDRKLLSSGCGPVGP